MQSKIIKIILLTLILTAALTTADLALAQADLGTGFAENLGLQQGGGDVRDIVVNIIRYFLTFLGIIAVGVILYAGFLWMTAGGRPDRINKAKRILISAVVGLIIIISAFAIVQFIINFTDDALAPACDAVCDPATQKCCPGNPDYCIDSGNICCAAEPSGYCISGENCCAFGCSAGPCSSLGPGASFTINSTVPLDNDANVIRNVRLRFNFNMTVDPATVDNTTFRVLDAGGSPVSGDTTVSGRQIMFEPDPGTCPANACGADRCFAANDTITVEAENIFSASGQALEQMIDPSTGFPNSCGGLTGPCTISFTVGDLIDCEDPGVWFSAFSQVCAAANNPIEASASDDSGVASLELRVNGAYFDSQNNTMAANPFTHTFNWDGTGFTVGDPVTFTAIAEDIDAHSASRDLAATLRPEHCCNNTLDADETGIDCGGADCAACDGAACGASLEDDCADAGLDCHNNDNRCSSRFCDCSPAGAAACEAAGYAAGVDDCCLCLRPPIIDWIAPMGGFCRDAGAAGAPTNEPCLEDSDCAAVNPDYFCDRTTANGARGNLVTIYGRNFGAAAGSVRIGGQAAPLAGTVPGCGGDYWHDTWITAQVPAGIAAADFTPLTVEITEAESGNDYTDSNTDNPGEEPVFDFIINQISRPGLCGISPESGPAQTTALVYSGIQLSTASAYFGNITSRREAINSALNDGQATVPLLSPGTVSTFALDGITYSNYLPFKVEAPPDSGPEITDFDPVDGAPGTYVTIYGRGFGSVQGGQSVDFGAAEADYDFPAICAGGVWRDSQVIVKVPDGLAPGAYTITMNLDGGPVDTTGLLPDGQFTANGLVRPNLCQVQPTAGTPGTAVALSGEDFGPGAGRAARFHLDVDQNTLNIEDTAEYDRVSAVIPAEALTGPVRMVRDDSGTAVAGNSIDLYVGSCGEAPDPDAACGAEFCCPAGTFREGQCAADPADPVDGCDLPGGSAVYEWEFDTRAGLGGIGDPCSEGTCAGGYPPCETGLVCDTTSCTCQMPCGDTSSGSCTDPNDLVCAGISPDYICNPATCYCELSIPGDTCQGRAQRLNSCAPDPCPNSGGFCSPKDGIEEIDPGSCNDNCSDFSDCGVGGADCTFDNDRCILDTAECGTTTTDIFGNSVNAVCQEHAGDYYWQFSTSASCPSADWQKIPGNICVLYDPSDPAADTCVHCPDDFSCQGGQCLSDNELCAGAAECDGTDCVETAGDVCECCCEIGFDARDCCTPLICAGSCGQGSADVDGDGSDESLGYCSGCASASDPDAACNCPGHSGQYCDTLDPAYPDGVCRDCSTLSADECVLQSGCCIDEMKGDACRAVSESGGKTGEGSCAYYGCDDSDPYNVVCDSAMATSGPYGILDACQEQCPGTGGLPPGSSCYATSTDTCGLTCTSPYGCYGLPPSDPSYDTCRCCCNPSAVDSCGDGTGLTCLADRDPCGGADRGLCCGCEADSDCASPPANTGCGSDTCCRARPAVEATGPADDAEGVCRNAAIEIMFDQLMDAGSIAGNIVVVGEYGGPCPAGTEARLFADGPEPDLNRLALIGKLKYYWHKFTRQLSAWWPGNSALAYETPQAGMNYCAIQGDTYTETAGGKTKAYFAPQELLDGERRYYAIVRGDRDLDSSRGVLSGWGIGMNETPANGSTAAVDYTFNGVAYPGSYIWTFLTLSNQAQNQGVCAIDRVGIDPASYLFQSTEDSLDENDSDPNNDSFDSVRDGDKVFTAAAVSSDGQKLSPVAAYSWDWSWSIDNDRIVDFSSEPDPVEMPDSGPRRLVGATSTTVDGNTYVRAGVNLLADDYSYGGDGVSGYARVYVFQCDNPWPPVDAGGLWQPWQDDNANCNAGAGSCFNTNFSMYYCRDAGNTGTYDDLPAIENDNTVIFGQSGKLICSSDGEPCPPGSAVDADCDGGAGKCVYEFLKEAYFPREAAPTETTALSVANQGEGGAALASWEAVAGAAVAGYRLYWGEASNNYADFATVRTNADDDHEDVECALSGVDYECRVDGLSNGRVYFFNLTSYFGTGAESDYFGEASLTVEDTEAPPAPLGLNAAAATSSIELSWNPADGAAGYNLYLSGGKSCAGNIPPNCYATAQDVGEDTAVIIQPLNSGTVYYFAVTAYDQAGNESPYSAEISAQPD